MRLVKSMLWAGAAVAGLGLLAPVLAQEWNSHRRTVHLTDGAVETILHRGNVVPRMIVQQAPAQWQPFAVAWPVFPAVANPSFAAIDHMMADMDRQMAMMMHQADLMTRLAQEPGLNQAVQGLPPGTTNFSMVQTSTGNGVCTRVTRITQGAQDAKPQVVSQTSGCGGSLHDAAPTNPDIKQINYRLPDAPTSRNHL